MQNITQKSAPWTLNPDMHAPHSPYNIAQAANLPRVLYLCLHQYNKLHP
jgi:hypothetical protein